MLAIDPAAHISLSGKSSWPHLDEMTVFNRLDDLRKNPDLLNQGALGLCGEAAFCRHVIQRNPLSFMSMGEVLFMYGSCIIGGLDIFPGVDLKKADYPAIVAAQLSEIASDPTQVPIPPQADWMILSAIRDSQNKFLDFEGTPHENFALGSDFDELSGWYNKSGLYIGVVKDENTDLNHVKTSVVKTVKNHIALRINAKMIEPSEDGGHIIALESPLTITSNAVTFKYWTWGDPVATANLTLNEFTDNYLGAITATF